MNSCFTTLLAHVRIEIGMNIDTFVDYQKGSCFLTIIVLLSNNKLSKYVLLSKRSAQYNNTTI